MLLRMHLQPERFFMMHIEPTPWPELQKAAESTSTPDCIRLARLKRISKVKCHDSPGIRVAAYPIACLCMAMRRQFSSAALRCGAASRS